jgi:galactoside O-acetyltransferase
MSGPTIPKKYLDGPRGPIRIGRHVILGAGTAIMPDLTIGDGCTLGALSLVKQDLDPWGVYAGIPVRRIKERSRRVPAWKFWP